MEFRDRLAERLEEARDNECVPRIQFFLNKRATLHRILRGLNLTPPKPQEPWQSPRHKRIKGLTRLIDRLSDPGSDTTEIFKTLGTCCRDPILIFTICRSSLAALIERHNDHDDIE